MCASAQAEAESKDSKSLDSAIFAEQKSNQNIPSGAPLSNTQNLSNIESKGILKNEKIQNLGGTESTQFPLDSRIQNLGSAESQGIYRI